MFFRAPGRSRGRWTGLALVVGLLCALPRLLCGLTLAPNTTYTGKLVLLDETKTPAEDISAEVKKETGKHLLLFEVTGTNVTITRTDKDKNNLEVDLETRLQTAAANVTGTTGTLEITLRHQPGTKNSTATPGDTDVEITFPTAVR